MTLKELFPSPHSGILFLYEQFVEDVMENEQVSVPSFGDSFFMRRCRYRRCRYGGTVSVPSFGDSFFIKRWRDTLRPPDVRFRPLIRGFFFY